MAKMETNENYTHACNSKLTNPENYICSIADAGYTNDEFKAIIAFYVLHAPTLKSDKSDSFGLKNLKDYGWRGNSDMNKLERELLKASGLQSFCFIKSSAINNTLEQMQLGTSAWCVEHPRAVLKQDYTVTIAENGKAEISNSETRMECLFRHLRNAFAHNHVYVFTNGNILLEDIDGPNKIITARILVPKISLLNWINIVKKIPSPPEERNDEKMPDILTSKDINTKSA
ncbi:MAG: hypothetical protein IJX82_01425 [Clostridia bacterium]|nr:hypothetical protein [Clostridia bacterium]